MFANRKGDTCELLKNHSISCHSSDSSSMSQNVMRIKENKFLMKTFTDMTVSVACDIFVLYYLSSKMEEAKFDTHKCAVQKSSITLCQSLMLR